MKNSCLLSIVKKLAVDFSGSLTRILFYFRFKEPPLCISLNLNAINYIFIGAIIYLFQVPKTVIHVERTPFVYVSCNLDAINLYCTMVLLCTCFLSSYYLRVNVRLVNCAILS